MLKTGLRIALYLIVMLAIGILLFKDILVLDKNPGNFETFINQDVPELMKKRGVPAASIAIIQNGAVSQVRTYGYVNIENKRSNSYEMRYRVASLSKPLTAWGIMKLVQNGKLELDRPVEDYLSRWKFPESEFNSSDVTVRRLLTHTAGVSVPSYGGYAPDNKRTTLIESLNGENVAYGPVRLIAPPGSGTRYSGGGYTILQLLIEEVSGLSYEKFMKEEVLDPLNFDNYTFTYDPVSEADLLALPYGRNEKPLPIYLYTEKAAGGFICSIGDLANLLLSFVNDQNVLSPEIIEMMTSKDKVPIIGILENDGNKYIGFGGTTLGYSADMWLDMTTLTGYVSVFNSTNGVYLGADIANQWLLENASTPDPTIKILNIEFYGIRMMAFILGNICILLAYRRFRMYRLHRESYSFRIKKKYPWLRIIYSVLVLSAILFWWISFHTLAFYPPINFPWLPDSLIYLSIFTTLILAHSAFKALFINKIPSTPPST